MTTAPQANAADLEAARIEAQKQWNARACEEMEGDKNRVEYFDAVAAKRYGEHPWMRSYFGYDRFAGKKVLEIGIGQGTDLASFALGGAICHGADIKDNHLMLTARNFALRGLDVDLRKADATALPFADSSMDCVYSNGVVHHIPDIERVLSEMHRVLVPGGTLMLAVYNKWSAFHFQKLAVNGIGQGWLFTKGYAGLLSTIEAGADGVAIKPYVRLYTKRLLQSLLDGFRVDDLSVHHLHANHFWPTIPLSRPAGPIIRRLDPRLGWYVCTRAKALK